MRKQNKRAKQIEAFTPLDESQLSDQWLLNNQVMERLDCSVNTYKGHLEDKLLPYAELGGRKYHNEADLQHLLITLRRLSLMLIPPVIFLTDWVEFFALDDIGTFFV